jgi:hypothetical protein
MAGAAEPGLLTDVTRQLADAADRTGGRMEQGGLQSVADELRSFARRQPGVFLLGAGLAGFLAARLLRAGVSQGSGNGRAPEGMLPSAGVASSAAAPPLPAGTASEPVVGNGPGVVQA